MKNFSHGIDFSSMLLLRTRRSIGASRFASVLNELTSHFQINFTLLLKMEKKHCAIYVEQALEKKKKNFERRSVHIRALINSFTNTNISYVVVTSDPDSLRILSIIRIYTVLHFIRGMRAICAVFSFYLLRIDGGLFFRSLARE